jgi:hypothetical protein
VSIGVSSAGAAPAGNAGSRCRRRTCCLSEFYSACARPYSVLRAFPAARRLSCGCTPGTDARRRLLGARTSVTTSLPAGWRSRSPPPMSLTGARRAAGSSGGLRATGRCWRPDQGPLPRCGGRCGYDPPVLPGRNGRYGLNVHTAAPRRGLVEPQSLVGSARLECER